MIEKKLAKISFYFGLQIYIILHVRAFARS